MSHHIPNYRILINDKNVTDIFQGRLISLTLKDERGNKADQLDISLEDSDDSLTLPSKKSIIKVWLGFKQTNNINASLINNVLPTNTAQPLIYKGSFVVDSIQYGNQSGVNIMQITARSADFKGSLKLKREQSWDQITIKDVLSTIATRHSLIIRISDALAPLVIDHIDQTDESDLSFLNRLAKLYDALCTIKDGNLLFSEIGNGLTISGKALDTLYIDKTQCSTYGYQTQERDSEYTGVQSYWNDKKYARRQTITAGSDENPKVLRTTYPSELQATQAAKSEWKKVNRNQASMSLELAIGIPDAIPEMPVLLTGFKEQIIVQKWGVESLEHSLNDKNLGTRANLVNIV
ncbi:contractile injection system protein, VgrG/Pvc8 family [Gammaproteobacteria bacterium AS21]